MNQPNFKLIGEQLKNAPNIGLIIEPFAAYMLVALIQLSLRHPQLRKDNEFAYQNGKQFAEDLTNHLAEIHPAIAESLELGWDESLDMTPVDFEQFSKNDDLPQRNYSQLKLNIQAEVLVNAYALDIACDLLASALQQDRDALFEVIGMRANERLERMTNDDIREAIRRIDVNRPDL